MNEQLIELRRQFTAFDKATVNKFDWEGRNKIYDHEISILSAALNQYQYEMRL